MAVLMAIRQECGAYRKPVLGSELMGISRRKFQLDHC
jgi:hypothetical protein